MADLGKIKLTMEGTWEKSKEYEPLSFVSYNGEGYISIKQVSSNLIEISNTEYWQKVAEKGRDGSNGVDGTQGPAGEITSVTATVDSNTGIPSCSVTEGGNNSQKTLTFNFKNLKGKDGVNATITGATATVDDAVGTPSVEVTSGGSENARSFSFAFKNLKGDKGDDAVANLLQVYPIGSIYMSINETNPHDLFGGTWARIFGKFLLGADAQYKAGSTGGKAKVSLTVDQLPAHTHNNEIHIASPGGPSGVGVSATSGNYLPGSTVIDNLSTGDNQSHENMPPYLAVYIWKRTA